ncbi:hypothetical protein [Hymenobacter lucidus]|uniref:Uncharacterized protein n=1 Tax=Hymenobacter lucidus TaxID=2880930 RepID=A0ABS8AXM8_9BACT|nr:hypothetical protein [Hymenobacter lucidus]MCB2410576.1 hypothetical protein [Hymenobacter lucidus]
MEQASLAFFQSFYTNVSLYVVPEPHVAEQAASASQPVSAAESGQVPVAVTPTPAAVVAAPAVSAAPTPPPVLQPAAAASVPPVTAAVPPAAPMPAGAGKLPSLGALPLPPAVRPAVAPAVSVAPPATPAPASPTDGPPPRTAPPLSATPYSTLGSNANGLVILVRMDPVRFQRLPRNVFLNNLLKAIRLVMEDVVLINVESHLPVELKTIRQQLAAKQIIGFGKNLLDVAIRTTQLYEPVLLAGDAGYLPAAEIELIEEDNSRKKLLWQAMQRMFLS